MRVLLAGIGMSAVVLSACYGAAPGASLAGSIDGRTFLSTGITDGMLPFTGSILPSSGTVIFIDRRQPSKCAFWTSGV